MYGPGHYAGITYCVPSNICRKIALRARIVLLLQDVVLVEANERLDKFEDWQDVIGDTITNIVFRLDDIESDLWDWDIERRLDDLEFEEARPFNDGMEWFEK